MMLSHMDYGIYQTNKQALVRKMHLFHILVDLIQADTCFWDYPQFHEDIHTLAYVSQCCIGHWEHKLLDMGLDMNRFDMLTMKDIHGRTDILHGDNRSMDPFERHQCIHMCVCGNAQRIWIQGHIVREGKLSHTSLVDMTHRQDSCCHFDIVRNNKQNKHLPHILVGRHN